MSRPEINVRKSKFDKGIELVSFLLILGSSLLIAFYYEQLPERIAIYFNWPSKDQDGLGSKDILWVSPVICGLIILAIYKLNKHPSLFNYPAGITPENAVYYYQMSTQMLRMVGLIIAFWCLVLTLMSVQSGLGNPVEYIEFSAYFFPALLVVLPVLYMIRIVWDKKGEAQ